MKTISLEYAKRLSEKVEACLAQALEIKKLLQPLREEYLKAYEDGDRDARERLSDEIKAKQKILFKAMDESTAIMKELSESEIFHGENQA